MDLSRLRRPRRSVAIDCVGRPGSPRRSKAARVSSRVGAVLGVFALVGWAVAGLGVASPSAPEREERQRLDRSLEDPHVREVLDGWARANAARRKDHPPFDELPDVVRDAREQRADRAEREERRRSPAEKQERKRTRTAFKNLGREGAVNLARQTFPQLFSGADRRALPLKPGERVLRYMGQRSAVVDTGAGTPSVVESTEPLRARDESGELRLVDLGLERTPTGWEPKASLGDIELGERADRALSFPGEFSVGVAGSVAVGVRESNEVFYADVATDTDAWFGPAPTGARFAFQLRSEDAPEELRLSIKDAPGVELRATPDAKGVVTLRDGEQIGVMSAPLAFDAEEKQIDVRVRVEGREIVIEVPHRGQDLRYPATVDPTYEGRDWKYGSARDWEWRYIESVPQFPHDFTNACCGNGFYIWRNPEQWFARGWLAEYQYFSPTVWSYIYAAELGHVRHYSYNTNTTQGIWSTTQSRHQHQYTQGFSFDNANNWYSVCANATNCAEKVDFAASRGNYLQSSLWANVDGRNPPGVYAWNYLGGARVWMSDPEPPTLLYWEDSPFGWVHDVPARGYSYDLNQAHVRWGDRGLGMWKLWMDVPGKARQYSTDAGGCAGTLASRCPESRAHTFSYAGISEGTPRVTTTGEDILGQTYSTSETLRIDRSPPALPTGSGSLYARADDFIGPATYTLGIQGSDSYSGVQSVSYRVVRQATGTLVASGTQSNSTCSSLGCSTSWKPASDFSVDASTWGPGRYTVEMTVKDLLGDDPTHGNTSHTRKSSFAVEMDGSPPSVAVIHEGLEPWLADDREVRTTVTGTDTESGVKSFKLDFPTDPDETRTRACAGTAANRCKAQDSETFTYRTNTERFPQEGRHQLRATVTDGRGIGTASGQWQVNIDRTAPDLVPAGTLYDRRGQQLPDGTYELSAEARDGLAGSSPAQERSGVRSLDIRVDGSSADFADQQCPEGSCGLDGGITFDTTQHPAGRHTVEIVATDHLDQVARTSFEFTSGKCCVEDPALWGNAGLRERILFGDPNGDGLSDLVAREPLSGRTEVALSTGTGYSELASWGSVPALDGASDVQLADVTGDGLDDLLGRNLATGQVLVAESDGEAFLTPKLWGTMTHELRLGDVDGDDFVDLVGRDRTTGTVSVAYSAESGPEAPVPVGSLDPALNFEVSDANGDEFVDLIGRAPSTGDVLVGLSDGVSFADATVWGTFPADRTLRFDDANGDGASDALVVEEAEGAVMIAASTGTGFASPEEFGNFPTGYSPRFSDANGDGQSDLVGLMNLTGEVRVALTNVVVPQLPPAAEEALDPDLSYDDSNDQLPDLEIEPPGEDPPVTASAAAPPPMKLAFQDDPILLMRSGLPGFEDEEAAFSPARSGEAEEVLKTYYYRRFREIANSSDAKRKPIIRFNVYWEWHQNGSGEYYWDKLDRAVDLARAQGFSVYLTLTGLALPGSKCNEAYNRNGMGCSGPVTGVNPPVNVEGDRNDFGDFASAAARQFKGRVINYAIWNEPNNDDFLRATSGGRDLVPAYLYRRLFLRASDRIDAADDGARVLFGEFSSLRYPKARLEPTSARRVLSAVEFFEEAVRGPDGTTDRIRTQGIAWHPYQHRSNPFTQGERNPRPDKGNFGIGRTEAINAKIRALYNARRPDGRRLLVGPQRKVPVLHFTEFGYKNQPNKNRRAENPDRTELETPPASPEVRKRNNYWHTEVRRAGLWRDALERARTRRLRVKWMLVYQPVERTPPELGPPGYGPEFGVFSRDSAITGPRGYGKDPDGDDLRTPTFVQPQRLAYCAIHRWAGMNGFNSASNECGG